MSLSFMFRAKPESLTTALVEVYFPLPSQQRRCSDRVRIPSPQERHAAALQPLQRVCSTGRHMCWLACMANLCSCTVLLRT